MTILTFTSHTKYFYFSPSSIITLFIDIAIFKALTTAASDVSSPKE